MRDARKMMDEGTRRYVVKLEDENVRLRECLEDMTYQFGHEFEQDGRRYLGTKGLSDLEDAFEVLGWDDPHLIPGDEK